MKNERLFDKSKHRHSAYTAAASRVFAADLMVDGDEKISRLRAAVNRLALQAKERRQGDQAKSVVDFSQPDKIL